MMQRFCWMMVVLLLAAAPAAAQEAKDRAAENRRQGRRGYPPRMPQAQVEVYKTVGDVSLRMYIFKPDAHRPSERRPAIVFFFGGGWRSGSPKQFEKQCEYFASRGLVAMTADYRVASRHGVKAVECVKDAKSAVRWIRANAERLGVDPDRIVASGGSAGGHIAACTAVIDEVHPEGADRTVSSRPNALVLFNPAMALAPVDDEEPRRDPDRFRKRTGVEPEAISPAHHVTKGLPPTIMFFGTDDRLLAGAEAFCRKARKLDNRCEILTWKGKGHGFFNYGRDGNKPFRETVAAADKFLRSQGYVDGEPTVEQFLKPKDE